MKIQITEENTEVMQGPNSLYLHFTGSMPCQLFQRMCPLKKEKNISRTKSICSKIQLTKRKPHQKYKKTFPLLTKGKQNK